MDIESSRKIRNSRMGEGWWQIPPLNRVVRISLFVVRFDLEEMRVSLGYVWGRTFPEDQTAGAKALRQRCGYQYGRIRMSNEESIRRGGLRNKGGEIL